MSIMGRYPSDLIDAQWALVDPLLSATKGGGCPEAHPRREIVNAILYLVRTGCSWRQLPKEFPPWGTVYWHFRRWRADGSLDRLHDALRDAVRDAEGRDEQPTAAIIDAQSVKGADTVSSSSRGYDAGKKVNGRKRHVVVDTVGMLLLVMVNHGQRPGPRRRSPGARGDGRHASRCARGVGRRRLRRQARGLGQGRDTDRR